MASHSLLDLVAFRASFPAFGNSATFPDVMVLAWYANAGAYMDQNDNADGLNGTTLDYALQLLACHLLTIAANIAANQTTQAINNATEGSVSVAFAPPPYKSGWEFWLSGSVYGQQLWALLNVQSTGGWSVGGLPESSAFRKAGGLF